MALADIPPNGQSRRLDSWKEVAEYLGRDVRTATRWEAQGLPVQRVPGGKGASVFAFTNEIDAWMAGRQADAKADIATETASAPVSKGPELRSQHLWPIALVMACAIGLPLAVALPALLGTRPPPDRLNLRVTATESDVSVLDQSGTARVIHTFAPDLGILPTGAPARAIDLNADGDSEILVGVSFYNHRSTRTIRHGELLNLSAAGAVRWRFGFDDHLRFGDRAINGPWAISDWQEGPAASPAKVAVAAHDYIWWGSMVAILDHNGRRLSAFVNPGWIESLFWLDKDRLAIAGFNNARNEAAVALLDANAADGQAPGTVGTAFACVTCPSSAPLFYATLPRSELNELTGGQFNRASVARVADQIVVTTVEMRDTSATAMYEFDRDFRILRARYSEAYWDAHKGLELEGRITHTREACPDRNGPAAIHVWSGSDWARTVASR